jgi:ethanolaminephosphotransferase
MPVESQDSLSDEVLAPLKSYKYSSVDKSFVSRYILKHYVRFPTPNLPPLPSQLPLHFQAVEDAQKGLLTRLCNQWNASVELLPLWLAPNMVTLLGFMFIVGNVALLEIYVPDLKGPVRTTCAGSLTKSWR